MILSGPTAIVASGGKTAGPLIGRGDALETVESLLTGRGVRPQRDAGRRRAAGPSGGLRNVGTEVGLRPRLGHPLRTEQIVIALDGDRCVGPVVVKRHASRPRAHHLSARGTLRPRPTIFRLCGACESGRTRGETSERTESWRPAHDAPPGFESSLAAIDVPPMIAKQTTPHADCAANHSVCALRKRI